MDHEVLIMCGGIIFGGLVPAVLASSGGWMVGYHNRPRIGVALCVSAIAVYLAACWTLFRVIT